MSKGSSVIRATNRWYSTDPDKAAMKYWRRPREQLDGMKDFTLRQMFYVASDGGNLFYSFILFLDAHGLLDDALPVAEALDVYKIDIIEHESEESDGENPTTAG